MSAPPLFVLAGLAALACTGCANRGQSQHTDAGLQIVATIPALTFIVREVAGEHSQVRSLLPPGASPHTFEPTIGDVRSLAQADLLVSVGGGFDDWAVQFAEDATGQAAASTRRLRILDLDGLGLLAADHRHDDHSQAHGQVEAPDPHIWLDPVQVRDAVVPAIAGHLGRLDPNNANAYHRRAEQAATMLTDLDQMIRRKLNRAPRSQYVAFHNAWRYFTERYGLHEIGVVEEAAGEEPTPREIASLVRGARDAGATAILVEPQLGSRMAETVAAEFSGTTITVDPLGDPRDPERANYKSLMTFNAHGFARALGITTDALESTRPIRTRQAQLR